jgi:hypothetical protein
LVCFSTYFLFISCYYFRKNLKMGRRKFWMKPLRYK